MALCIHQVIKEDLERAYKNTNMKPMSHSTYLRLQVLRKIFWDVDEKLKVLTKLTFSDLVAFAPKFLSQVSSTTMTLCIPPIFKPPLVLR